MAEEVIVINEPNEIAKDSLTRYYEKGVLQRLGIQNARKKQPVGCENSQEVEKTTKNNQEVEKTTKNNQKQPKTTLYVYVYVYVYVYDNYVSKETNILEPSKEASMQSFSEKNVCAAKEPQKSSEKKKSKKGEIDYAAIKDCWNEQHERLGIDWKPEKQRMRAKLAALGRFHAPDGKFISKQILNA